MQAKELDEYHSLIKPLLSTCDSHSYICSSWLISNIDEINMTLTLHNL